MVFWNYMKIVWLAFFHTFDVGNCMIRIFGVGKSKISIFGLWRSTQVVFQLHFSVTLPFQAFLLVLISFLYKTAQKPLKNRPNLAWNRSKTTARNERFLSGFLSKIWAVWAVFPKKNRPNRSNRSNLAGKPLKPLISWAVFERDLNPGSDDKLADNRDQKHDFSRFSRSYQTHSRLQS